MTTFSELGLCEKLCKTADSIGWVVPMKIQVECIPKAIKGEDVAGMAETGSGKTGAFLLSMLHRFIEADCPPFFSVIIAPTHELVIQISSVLSSLIPSDIHVKTSLIYGGANDVDQMLSLSDSPNFIVACPGRLSNLLSEARGLSIKNIKIVIIDEADKIIGTKFFDEVKEIIRRTNYKRQLMLFSATLPSNVASLSALSIQLRTLITVNQKSDKPETLREQVVAVLEGKKFLVLDFILENNKTKTIIFTSSVRFAIIVFFFLKLLEFPVGTVHGQLNQEEREETLEEFRKKSYGILVSTDVAARGVDIPDVELVINFDVPRNGKEYTHRSGRTGRAGREGLAITLVTKDDVETFLRIEKSIKRKVENLNIIDDQLESLVRKTNQAHEDAVSKYKKLALQRQRSEVKS